MINYNKRIFKPIQNSNNAETTQDTIFVYQQEENIVSSTYTDGKIKQGHLLGLVDEQGCITMRYHQVNRNGELMTGICNSSPEVLPNGKIRLHEIWQWTSGDTSKGKSILEEQ